MKILKFGGTSVGSAERMKNLVPLIVNDETKIVVLSAMSGTTNSLVEIGHALYEREEHKASQLIDVLEKKYEAVVQRLYSNDSFLRKAQALMKEHFTYIRYLAAGDGFNSRKE